jgi:NhaP-type Na+/H+ or K+/H+ antiporter
MLKLKELRLGTEKMIPQLIMAGSSMDDVFVIVIFTSLLSLSSNHVMSSVSLITLPTSLIFGIMIGIITGLILSWWFTRFHIRDTGKVIIMLSSSFLLLSLEHINTTQIGFSSLLAVMIMGATIQIRKENVAQRLSFKFSKLWLAAEVLLFVLVGALVSIDSIFTFSLGAVVVLAISLLFRCIGVVLSLVKTNFNYKEKLFTIFTYLPKATVQAAIGGIPLAMNHPQGELILSMAVISILITAPLGAFLMDRFNHRLLK